MIQPELELLLEMRSQSLCALAWERGHSGPGSCPVSWKMSHRSEGSRWGERRSEKMVSPGVSIPDSKLSWSQSTVLTSGPKMRHSIILTAQPLFSLSWEWSLANPAMNVILFKLTPFLFLQGANEWPALWLMSQFTLRWWQGITVTVLTLPWNLTFSVDSK